MEICAFYKQAYKEERSTKIFLGHRKRGEKRQEDSIAFQVTLVSGLLEDSLTETCRAVQGMQIPGASTLL